MRTKSVMAKTTNPNTVAGRLRTACAASFGHDLLVALIAAARVAN
jgi:hypothetical protein